MKNVFVSIYHFYADGFKNMTWGRQLWWLILLKVIILFVVLRLFWLSSYLVWVSIKLSNAKEEKFLIDDTSEIGSKKFDFSIE